MTKVDEMYSAIADMRGDIGEIKGKIDQFIAAQIQVNDSSRRKTAGLETDVRDVQKKIYTVSGFFAFMGMVAAAALSRFYHYYNAPTQAP